MDLQLTPEQADTIHSGRGNADWTDLSHAKKTAAINHAIDYATAFYLPLKPTVEADNSRLILGLALLAREMANDPPSLSADQMLKSKTIKSGTKEIQTVYQDADKAPDYDPFPIITGLFASLRVAPATSTGGSISFGRMV